MQESFNFESVELELPDALFVRLALMAHEKNITLNHLIQLIIADGLLKDAKDNQEEK